MTARRFAMPEEVNSEHKMASTPVYRGQADPLRAWRRMVTVKAIAGLTNDNAARVATRFYGKTVGDQVTKAAVAPADTVTPAWAGALVGTVIGPFLRSLRGKSAAAQLIEMGEIFNLRDGFLSFPKLASAFPNAAWVAEGGAAPAFQGSLTSTTLAPRKLMALAALTNELAQRSAEDAERIIGYLLADSVSRALDAKMFSADAATATAPAGLFAGIGATAGVAGGGQTAMAGDLKALTAAVATAGGGGNLVIIASPAQAMSLQVLGGAGLKTPIIIGPSLPAGTAIVIDAGAFISGFSAEPQIEVRDSPTVHLEDTNPLQLVTGAQGAGVVAAPSRSAFQADFKVLRCTLRVGYALRTPALAWTSSATW